LLLVQHIIFPASQNTVF